MKNEIFTSGIKVLGIFRKKLIDHWLLTSYRIISGVTGFAVGILFVDYSDLNIRNEHLTFVYTAVLVISLTGIIARYIIDRKTRRR